MTTRTTAALILSAFALAACGGEDAEPEQKQEVAAPVESTQPPAASPEAPPAPPSPAAAASTGAACEDPAGDSTDALDLRSVTVSPEDDQIVFAYQFSGAVPPSGSVLWSTLAGTKQYGYKIVDGAKSAHFVFNFADGQQQDVAGQADLDGDVLEVTFPAEQVGKVAGGTAALNVQGDDVDNCTLS